MSANEQGRTETPRVLLTALGTRAEAVTYRLGERSAEAPLAPLALLELLGEPFDLVLVVCTDAATKTTLPVLEERLHQMQLSCEVVHVPEAVTVEELTRFVETVAERVTQCCAGGARLSVDLTHGFRHHSVLLYATCLYIASLDRLTVDHVWYSPLAKDRDAEVIDLQPLLLLPQAVHAVRELRESGSARSLARLLASEPKGGADVRRSLEALTRALVAGLPIEAGTEAANVLRGKGGPAVSHGATAHQLQKVLGRMRVPLAQALVDDLAGLLGPLVIGAGVKAEVVLDEAELARQARLIDLLAGWESLHIAVGLMREWLVSWAVWASCGNERVRGSDWLGRRERRRAERSLNALRLYADDADLRNLLRPEQKRIADFWRRLADLRNAYMHFGMQSQLVDPLRRIDGSDLHKAWDDVRRFWQSFKSDPPQVSLNVASGTGRVLVSALGLSPGVLTNAVRIARRTAGGDPECLVVLCSDESRGLIEEACGRASWAGKLIVRPVADPFAQVDLMRPKAGRHLPGDPDLRRMIAGAEEVFVNLTGGTTTMGVLVQQVAEAAWAFERPVRRFVLVDRRSADEQRRDPWAASEAVFLDEGDVTDGS